MWEETRIGNIEDMAKRHAFGILVDEVMRDKDISKVELENRTGISDSILGRIINDGQEPTFEQFAKIVKGLEIKFWYAVQRSGESIDSPETPDAEARRLGSVFAEEPELLETANILMRLNRENRQAVLRMARSFLEEPGDLKAPISRSRR